MTTGCHISHAATDNGRENAPTEPGPPPRYGRGIGRGRKNRLTDTLLTKLSIRELSNTRPRSRALRTGAGRSAGKKEDVIDPDEFPPGPRGLSGVPFPGARARNLNKFGPGSA